MSLRSRVALGLVVPVAIVVSYALWSANAASPYFPPLDVILTRFRELWLFDLVASDVLPSLKNLGLGLLLAVIAGIPCGAILGRIRWMGEMFGPLLDFWRSVPPIMLIPPLVLILGIEDSAKVTIIAVGSFFPVCVATADGMRQADPTLVDAARAMRLGPLKTMVDIYLRAGSPAILGGIQIGLQAAFVLMVASEMLAAYRGIGYLTMQAQVTFDSVTMWAGTLLLALLGFTANAVFVAIRNRVLSWHTGMRVSRASS
ncbi:aliphatic sulfonate ABC transporter permease SsuC [Nocardioides ginsengisoli]|uniref:ABC transporter permease n=1 Tax=Nocardioides ginsengisoli TaxID=363868 RepID=A0ABW3W4H5_9ACTN